MPSPGYLASKAQQLVDSTTSSEVRILAEIVRDLCRAAADLESQVTAAADEARRARPQA